VVRSGAMLSGVFREANELTLGYNQNDFVLVIGGTNNVEGTSVKDVLNDFDTLLEMTKNTNLIVASLPMRHDKPNLDDKISLINEQLINRIKITATNIRLLELHLLPRDLYTRQGMHFNRKGKRKIGEVVLRLLRDCCFNHAAITKKKISQPSPEDPVIIVEDDMNTVIHKLRDQNKIAFAHCISTDFHSNRHMSAGVATTFKKHFNTPLASDFVSESDEHSTRVLRNGLTYLDFVKGLRSQLEIMVRKDSTENFSSDKTSLQGSTTNLCCSDIETTLEGPTTSMDDQLHSPTGTPVSSLLNCSISDSEVQGFTTPILAPTSKYYNNALPWLNNFVKLTFQASNRPVSCRKTQTQILNTNLPEFMPQKSQEQTKSTRPPQQNTQTSRNHHKITLIHQNINWLSNKLDRLAHFLNEQRPDLIIITEHGIPEENLQNMCLERYSLVGGFTRKAHKKGGVLGPPSANLNNAIDILLDQLEGALQTKTKTILMGDVNVDNLVANSDNSKLEELLSSFDIIRESLPSTRITAECLYGKKPSYKGAAYFNHLPEHLKKEPIKRLKNQLTIWLQENPYYTEKEFFNT
ncbi:hypothetical protein J6590_105434, partial [Homalodisca vitripennis]